MKKLSLYIFLSFLGCFTILTQAREVSSDTTSSGTLQVYYDSTQTYKVAIQTNTGLLSVLEVPEGVFLNVQINPPDADAYQVSELPHTFRGDIIIRACREDDLEEKEQERGDMYDIMSKASFELKLKNSVVIVEKG